MNNPASIRQQKRVLVARFFLSPHHPTRTLPDTPPIPPNFVYCASPGLYYFGYNLHALTGLSGVFGDKDPISESVQPDLFESVNIGLECRNYAKQTDGLSARIIGKISALA